MLYVVHHFINDIFFIYDTDIQTKMDSYNWLRDETRKDEVRNILDVLSVVLNLSILLFFYLTV